MTFHRSREEELKSLWGQTSRAQIFDMRISVADAFCQIVLWQWHRSSSKSVMRLLCSSSGAAKLWPCCYHHKLVEDIIFAPLCRQHPFAAQFHTPLSYRYLTDDAKAVNGVTITLTVLSKLKTNFFGSAEKHPLFQAQLVHTKVFFVTQHQRIIEIIILQVLSVHQKVLIIARVKCAPQNKLFFQVAGR